ncbi:MAG: hypothetical protein AAGK33_08215 [Pseudomonadota bacterium]
MSLPTSTNEIWHFAKPVFCGAFVGFGVIATIVVGMHETAKAEPAKAELDTGALSQQSIAVSQVVSVKNLSDKEFTAVKVGCGFFKGGSLIASDKTFMDNIAPQDIGYGTILSVAGLGADKADCRIISIR